MTPEEIVERAAEVLGEHVWQAGLGGCTPTCGWHGPEDETEQSAHARHQVDVLADAGLLPTEVEWAFRNQQGHLKPGEEMAVRDRAGVLSRDVVRRYVTPWAEVTS